MLENIELLLKRDNATDSFLFNSKEAALTHLYFVVMLDIKSNPDLLELVFSNFKEINKISLGSNIDNKLEITNSNSTYREQLIDIYFKVKKGDSFCVRHFSPVSFRELILSSDVLSLNGELTGNFTLNRRIIGNPFYEKATVLKIPAFGAQQEVCLDNIDVSLIKINPKTGTWDFNPNASIIPYKIKKNSI